MFISTDNDAWVKCNGVCNRDSRKVQTPANGGTVTFEKEYKLVGEGISPAETFEFNIAKAGVENGGVDAENRTCQL